VSETQVAVHGHGAMMEASPYAIPSRKLTMWLFIISDAITFGACLFAYGYLRTASTDWPTPFKFYPSILNVVIMTFVLITSSLTMLGAVDAAKVGDKAKQSLFVVHYFYWSLIRGTAHSRMDGIDRRGSPAIPQSVGITAFRSHVL